MFKGFTDGWVNYTVKQVVQETDSSFIHGFLVMILIIEKESTAPKFGCSGNIFLVMLPKRKQNICVCVTVVFMFTTKHATTEGGCGVVVEQPTRNLYLGVPLCDGKRRAQISSSHGNMH